VLVQQYRSHPNKPRRGAGAKMSALTTADVAQFLEKRYALMETFYRVHEKDVAKAIEGSLEGALSALLSGARVNPWARGMGQIETAFRDFISTREAERVGIPGTPTKAALRGVNHRLKHPYAARNPRRPSFRDTGLYMASFRAWVD
jgi:hypothetical protein